MPSENSIREQIEKLLNLEVKERGDETELSASTLSLLTLVYGKESNQVAQFKVEHARAINDFNFQGGAYTKLESVPKAYLRTIKSEIDLDLIGGFDRKISGEVLSDFLQFARDALAMSTEGSKNVAAVLTAALFEDTMRRLAANNGITHQEKLEAVLLELKKADVLTGAQPGVAQSFLQFRNKALHAQWENVDRPDIQSVLAFTEEMLLKHFS